MQRLTLIDGSDTGVLKRIGDDRILDALVEQCRGTGGEIMVSLPFGSEAVKSRCETNYYPYHEGPLNEVDRIYNTVRAYNVDYLAWIRPNLFISPAELHYMYYLISTTKSAYISNGLIPGRHIDIVTPAAMEFFRGRWKTMDEARANIEEMGKELQYMIYYEPFLKSWVPTDMNDRDKEAEYFSQYKNRE